MPSERETPSCRISGSVCVTLRVRSNARIAEQDLARRRAKRAAVAAESHAMTVVADRHVHEHQATWLKGKRGKTRGLPHEYTYRAHRV